MTEGTSVNYTFKMEGEGRVETAEQIVAAPLPAHCCENAGEDGRTGLNPETVG